MQKTTPPELPQDIAAKFAAIAPAKRAILMHLRQCIFNAAQTDARIGTLLETLKWGQPSYLTAQTKSGTTVRLGLGKTGQPALFVHCQTTVVPDFRALHEADFTFDGNRAIYFKDMESASDPRVDHLIGRALTYHLS